ncbi:MAG: 3-oxoacyl-ACP synthase [Bacteroidia bacterium]|nr:3-oxoacyl-ACP synthase [Bacteroidia bacterium]
MNTIKQKLLEHCYGFVSERLETIKAKISELQASLDSETKSSAGDKHETGRAMIQIEREKSGQQLAELQKLTRVLNKIDWSKHYDKIALGSVVITSKGQYFIAISAGEIILENERYFAISQQTPMAQALISKTKGDLVSFRETELRIIEVF